MNTAVILFFCGLFLQAQIYTTSARALLEESSVVPLSKEEAQCVKDLSLNEKHILQLNNEEISTENDNDFNKFLECYWKQIKLQDSEGKINFETLREVLQTLAAEELKDEDEDVVFFVQQLARRAVTYCEYHPSTGYSHGQICAKTQNCIMKKLQELISELEDL